VVLKGKKKISKKEKQKRILDEVDRNARKNGMTRIGVNRWVLRKK
jgi:hypothetical protein